MREFTKDEKQLLKLINKGIGCNLYNLIDPWIQNVSFKVDTNSNIVTFIFEDNGVLDLQTRLKEIQTIVIQSVNIIKLFEEKGYIFTFINSNQLPPNPFIFGQAAVNSPSIEYQFPDPRISKLFSEYSIKEIYVTPELKKFISDGFITREEGRANRQFRITRNALIVSISALMANLFFNIYNNSKSKNENKYCKFELHNDSIVHEDRNLINCFKPNQKKNSNDSIKK